VILSNTHILAAIDAGEISIESLAGRDVSKPPFNTSAVDLRLAKTISIPKSVPATIRLDQPYDKIFVERNCEQKTLSVDQPYDLKPNHFVLAQTIEKSGISSDGRRSVLRGAS